MKSLADELDDETEPTTGEEIGAAVSAAIADVAQSNAQAMRQIALTIADAMKAVESKQIVVQSQDKPVVRKWNFKVVRDAKGFMTDVIATAT